MKKDKLMLIDGNSIINRAYYALSGRNTLSTSDGLVTNAVFGFVNILKKYIDEESPQYIGVAFDLRAPTFRHIEYSGYKAKRKGMPDELANQLPIVKEVLDAMNIKRIEQEGYEADDIIGAISLCGENKGLEVVIITGDRDALQLATKNTRIKIPTTRKGKTETEEYDFDKVFEKYEIEPSQFIDIKGLMGDSSDNIPGVSGIGEKTAFKLIKEYKSIDKVYENLDSIKKDSVKEKLLKEKDVAFLSRKLGTIERNIPGLCPVEELKHEGFNNKELYDIFTKLEFRSLISKFELANNKEESHNPKMNTTFITEKKDLKNILKEIIKAQNFSYYCFIEKDGYNENLAGISFVFNKSTSYYIRINDSLKQNDFLLEFKDVFEDPKIKIHGHDVKNLIIYLKKKGIKVQGIDFDIMLACYILDPVKGSRPIDVIAEEYLGRNIKSLENLIGKGKNQTGFNMIPIEQQAEYAVSYASVIFDSKEILKSQIMKNKQEKLYYEVELPLTDVLANMEYTGFKVNINELRRYGNEIDDSINQIAIEIIKIAGKDFNINSPKQLGKVLYEQLHLPVIKKTKTGYSTDAEVLEQLVDKHKIIRYILDYRQLVKIKTTYVDGLISAISPQTGKIHTSFNQAITATGRLSSTEPNLQNIPIKIEVGRKIRKSFIPSDENYLLIGADYSQIELRLLADISKDEKMIKAFLNDEDIHRLTASKLFDKDINEVTSEERGKAKTVNFSVIYGIGDFSLSKDLGITRKEAKAYIEEYLNNYPSVREYMKSIIEKAKENGYVTTSLNRIRYLPELKSKNFNIRSFGERVAMNTPLQGTAADIIKIAMINACNEFKKRNLKSRIILQVHDEILVEAYQDEKDEAKKIIKDCMENAVSISVPLRVEVKSGLNWYELK